MLVTRLFSHYWITKACTFSCKSYKYFACKFREQPPPTLLAFGRHPSTRAELKGKRQRQRWWGEGAVEILTGRNTEDKKPVLKYCEDRLHSFTFRVRCIHINYGSFSVCSNLIFWKGDSPCHARKWYSKVRLRGLMKLVMLEAYWHDEDWLIELLNCCTCEQPTCFSFLWTLCLYFPLKVSTEKKFWSHSEVQICSANF